jgi:hypothetical protein
MYQRNLSLSGFPLLRFCFPSIFCLIDVSRPPCLFNLTIHPQNSTCYDHHFFIRSLSGFPPPCNYYCSPLLSLFLSSCSLGVAGDMLQLSRTRVDSPCQVVADAARQPARLSMVKDGSLAKHPEHHVPSDAHSNVPLRCRYNDLNHGIQRNTPLLLYRIGTRNSK